MNTFIYRSIRLSLVALLLVFSSSCEKTRESQNNVTIKDVDYEKIKSDVELTTKLIANIDNDEKFLLLTDDQSRFNYIKNVAAKEYGISSEYTFQQFKETKAAALSWENINPSPNARTSAGDPMSFFSSGEREFVNFTKNSTDNAADLATFNNKIAVLRNGLMTPNFYPWLNYSTDRIGMLNNWLTYYKEYVNQWPSDDFNTFNPYNLPGVARTDATARTAGSCKGFRKKLCIAFWTAIFASAGTVANIGAGTLVGGAAGYLFGRCCRCCSCDNISVNCDA